MDAIRKRVALGRPVRFVGGPVCGRGFRLGPLIHLAVRCLRAGLPAGLPVSRGHRIPGITRAAGGAQRPGAPPAPDQPACHVALDARPQRRGHCPDHFPVSSSAADSGASSSWSTIRPSPFLPWSCSSSWLSLACTAAAVQALALLNDAVEAILATVRLPRERGRRGTWRDRSGLPSRARWTFSGKKRPARGTGPEPQSSGRGVIALWE